MLELRYEYVELFHHGLHCLRLAEIDACFLEQSHRMIAASGFQQREISGNRFVALIGTAGLLFDSGNT